MKSWKSWKKSQNLVGKVEKQCIIRVEMSILNKDKAINNGALFENVVAQELLAKGFKEHYFNSKKQGKRCICLAI